MRWMEVINLRSSGTQLEMLGSELLESLRVEALPAGLLQVKTYRHATVDTDVSIHLYWESRDAEKDGSPLGLRLVEACKPFGLVYHSVRLEKEKGDTLGKQPA